MVSKVLEEKAKFEVSKSGLLVEEGCYSAPFLTQKKTYLRTYMPQLDSREAGN